jgi:hypothetical protein
VLALGSADVEAGFLRKLLVQRRPPPEETHAVS